VICLAKRLRDKYVHKGLPKQKQVNLAKSDSVYGESVRKKRRDERMGWKRG